MPDYATDPFVPAVEELIHNGLKATEPQSFKAYCDLHGFSCPATASFISIDTRRNLKTSLSSNDFMVYRLGSPTGERGTHFALAKGAPDLKDCFLTDNEVFSKAPELFAPDNISWCDQFIFKHSFKRPTETLAVNLGFASGLFAHALGDPDGAFSQVPAMGLSTFSFPVYPSSGLPELCWLHQNGQVEIDAVFAGRFKDQKSIFVLEAKYDGSPFTGTEDLAKFKLAYAVQAIAGNIPGDWPIIPVYLRVNKSGEDLEYRLCVCSMPDPRREKPFTDLIVQEAQHCYTLQGFAKEPLPALATEPEIQ